ncbi:MAG: ABC transporter permease [Clostridiales Family XIII bacterium]|jgi:teichoic acid transport system permease protein|nr:ABC transporter permease [Clostridiales Family XIII bacterium]
MRTFLKIIKQHIVWRHQLVKLAKADLVKTYSGAALGWVWAIIKPMVMIFCFWFAFGVGLRLSKGDMDSGYPFILWLIAGMIPWFYISEIITAGANSLRQYSYLVTKMRFPIATVPTFVSISKLMVHLGLVIITIIIFALYGHPPDKYLLQLPIYILCMFLFFIAWGTFSSMLTCMSKDFYNLVEAFVQALFWLSGILYDVHTMDVPEWLRVLLLFNPITFIADGFRNTFIYKVWIWETPNTFWYFIIMLTLMAGLGLWAYRKLYKEIPDVL